MSISFLPHNSELYMQMLSSSALKMRNIDETGTAGMPKVTPMEYCAISLILSDGVSY